MKLKSHQSFIKRNEHLPLNNVMVLQKYFSARELNWVSVESVLQIHAVNKWCYSLMWVLWIFESFIFVF